MKTDAQDGLFWKVAESSYAVHAQDNVDAVTMTLYMTRFRAYWGIIDGRGIYGSNAAS